MLNHIRKSRLFLSLAVVLGIVPALIGGLLSYDENKKLEIEKQLYQEQQKKYKIEIERYHQQIAEYESSLHAMAADSDNLLSSDEDIQAFQQTHEIEPPLPPVVMTTATPADPKGLTPSNWAALGGVGNGVLFAFIAWMWKRKEDFQELGGVVEDVFKGDNDLSRLSVHDRLVMMIESMYNANIHARYKLRKDPNWSVYNALCGVIDVPSNQRPFFVVNRQQRPWDEIVGMFGSLNASHESDEVRLHEMAVTIKRPVDMGLWKISLAFDTFDAAVKDAGDTENLIFIVVKNEDDEIKHHTLTSDEAFPPNCLESWELFVDAFRNKFYGKGKTDSTTLELIFVAYVPV